MQILNLINNKYAGLTYLTVDGTKQNLSVLLPLLSTYYKSKNLII